MSNYYIQKSNGDYLVHFCFDTDKPGYTYHWTPKFDAAWKSSFKDHVSRAQLLLTKLGVDCQVIDLQSQLNNTYRHLY